jgi:hypothetical protein
MSILNRPYAGTWQANKRSVVAWTPDFLVYVNGDTSLPGCQTCRRQIDLNEFVNSISVDFGVEPGASNCSIGMAIPRHYGDTLFRDGNTLLRPALEIHVYFRGYFPMRGLTSPNSQPVAGINLSDIPQHPYYPVFHGVVTQVTHEYSGGFYTANMTCAGMLHFWETQKLSGASGGSFFGARPVNSGVRTTLTGHPMSGKSPYSIIYSLYRDTAGVADGVGFALSSRTNYGAVNATTGDSLYAMTLRYWEQRFRGKIYGLRMHGASGQLFTSSQQAYLSMYGTAAYGGGSAHSTGNVNNSTANPGGWDVFAQDPTTLLGMRVRGADGKVLRQPDTRLAGAVDNRGRLGLDVMKLQAFPTDIGSYGQVNLWESTYESKMDVATAVTNVCGYEFYQDADGDLVFKPPLYNLDTSSSRVYRIEPEDIVSINFTEAEPNATYCIVKGGAFQNMRGVVDESEWGCRSTYVDYKLVAQYGWKEASIESTYYTNAKSAFFFAINYLDRQNAGTNGCTVTIPLRPEIRPGYPVYIPHIDCFYYVTQVSHSFNLGSECTTSLTLTARRRKFLPPGASGNANVAFDQNLTQIDLAATSNPVRPLQTLDGNRVPRITGFPNVVMAIDPTRISPLFQVLGFQAVEREPTTRNAREGTSLEGRRIAFVWQFLRMMLTRTPRMLNPYGQPTSANGTLPTDDDFSADVNRQYEVVGVPGPNGRPLTVTVGKIEQALETYISSRATLKRARALLVDQIVEQQNSINNSQRQYQQAQRQADARENQGQPATTVPQPPSTSTQTERITQLQQQLKQFDDNFDAVPPNNDFAEYAAQYETLTNITNSVGDTVGGRNPPHLPPQEAGANPNDTILMSYLIGTYRTEGAQSGDTVTDPSGTTNQSATLLENLSDRKASLSLTVPGYYRYYSASHPNVAMQGYERIDTTGTPSPASGSTAAPDAENSTGLTPIVRRPGRNIARAGGYISGPRQDVLTQTTPLTPLQAAGYLAEAWRRVVRSPPLNRSILEILVAQWSHETGSGRSMNNWNFGGLKYGGGGLAAVYNLTHEVVNGQRVELRGAAFQAYPNAQTGAAHFVTFLTDRERVSAIQQYLANPGNATAYARELKRARYFTSEFDVYGRDLQGRVNGIRRSGLLDSIPNLPPAPDPVQSPPAAGTAANQSTTSEPPITTYGIRPITDGQGLPPDRIGQYVELFPNHRPTNGLRVRVPDREGTVVLPTNLIYAMTIESRKRRIYTRTAVPRNNPFNPRDVSVFIDLCLQPSGPTGPILTGLTDLFKQQVGTSALSVQRTTFDSVRELITFAVEGITDLRTATGPIENTLNIPSNGVPGNYNPSGLYSITPPNNAETVLRAKAAALLHDVTVANQVQLQQAKDLISRLGPNEVLTTEIQDLLQPWERCLQRLYRGRPLPSAGPFRAQNSVEFTESESSDFSPVFPVSDALGYDHYGSFQYGRGLSIEPGGNYERLMSTDPLQYLEDSQRERFLRELRSPPDGRGGRIRALFEEFSRDPRFSNSPGAQAALDYLENDQRNGDRTTMIANGLRNYIASERDATMKMPINNVAYQMADLRPMGQQDTCECRGAEADLLLAAYMAGTESYALITSADEASIWVSAQMQQAAQSWSEAQSRMRGMSADQGRRSVLDTVEGWKGMVNDFRTTNQQNVAGVNQTVGSANAVAERTQQLFTRPLVPNRGQ